MPLGIGLRTAQARFLRAGEQHDDLRILKTDIRFCQRFERAHGNIAAGEVIVRTRYAFERILKKQKTNKAREQAKQKHAKNLEEDIQPAC